MSISPVTNFNAYEFFQFINTDTTPEAFDAQCSTISETQRAEPDTYREALRVAAICGNNTLVKHIVQDIGQDVDSGDIDGNTAIGGAIYVRNYATVKLLIELGADPHSSCVAAAHIGDVFDSNPTPLELAVHRTFPIALEQTLNADLTLDNLIAQTDSKIIKLFVGLQETTRPGMLYEFQFNCLVKVIEQLNSEVAVARETIRQVIQLPLPNAIRDIVNEYSREEEIEPAFIGIEKTLPDQIAALYHEAQEIDTAIPNIPTGLQSLIQDYLILPEEELAKDILKKSMKF